MVNAVVVLGSNESFSGTIYFTQEADGSTTVTGNTYGLKPALHGFHVHALGDTTNGCMSTGPHFNPAGKEHGAPEDENQHAGDLGNVTIGDDGTAKFPIIDKNPLSGPNSIIGRAVLSMEIGMILAWGDMSLAKAPEMLVAEQLVVLLIYCSARMNGSSQNRSSSVALSPASRVVKDFLSTPK